MPASSTASTNPEREPRASVPRPARVNGAGPHPAVDAAAPEAAPATGTDASLGALVATFEELLASRVRTGERLRALVQGRLAPRSARKLELLAAVPPAAGDVAPTPEVEGTDCDALLRDVATGRTLGPSPSLGRLYREQHRQEAALRAAFVDALERHPAWPWLSGVRGIGPTLAAQLLARLDLARAPHPSSFWAFCGLATVAAARLRCGTCGATLVVAAGRPAPSSHFVAGGRRGERCPGALAPVGEAPAGRVAQPCRVRGASRAFDPAAKRVCYLVGLSFTRQGGHYKAFFRERLSRYAEARPEWTSRHRYLAALRVTEKLFLAHLWCAWREALGLPPAPRPPASSVAADAPLDPWAMVDRPSAPRRDGAAPHEREVHRPPVPRADHGPPWRAAHDGATA